MIAPVVIVALLAAGTWRAARFDLQPQQEIDNALHLASDAPRLSRDA